MEEVEQLISKHVIFQKVLTFQDKKVMGSGTPEHDDGGVFRRGTVAGCRNSIGMSVELRVALYIWLKKRPRLGCSTLQGPQGAFT